VVKAFQVLIARLIFGTEGNIMILSVIHLRPIGVETGLCSISALRNLA